MDYSGSPNFGATTFTITTLGIMTSGIMGLVATLGINGIH